MSHHNFTSFDLQKLYNLNSRVLWRSALCGATVGALLFLAQEPRYKAQAVFKDAGIERDSSGFGSIQGLLSSGPGASRGFASVVMQSHELLADVARDLGMQIRQAPPKPFKRFANPLGFSFKNVQMPLDEPMKFTLIFDENGNYTHSGQGSFELGPLPEGVVPGHKYVFLALPLDSTVSLLQKRLRFATSQEDGRILTLLFEDPVRNRAPDFLNHLMAAYSKHLKAELAQMADDQIDYLLAHNEKLMQAHEKDLAEYAGYLEQESREHGPLSLKHAVEMMAQFEKDYQQREFEIDVKREGLGASKRSLGDFPEVMGRDLEMIVGNLAGLENARATLVTALHDPQIEGAKNRERQVELRLSKLAEQTDRRFEGIDLEGGNKLLLDYQNRLDALILEAKRLEYQRSLIAKGDYTTDVQKDAVTVKMLEELRELKRRIDDGKVLSAREIERYNKEFDRKFAAANSHIDRLARVCELERELTVTNTRRLKEEMLLLTDQKIAALQAQLDQNAENQLLSLEKERSVVRDKLASIKRESGDLSKRWLIENRFDTKMKLSKMILAGISELVESKSAENNLKTLLSKPVEYARMSKVSKWKLTYLFPSVFAFLGFFGSFGVVLARRLRIGLPVAIESLKFLGDRVYSGSRSEQIRAIASERAAVLGLLLGSGDDYASALARSCTAAGQSVVVVDCDFLQIAPPEQEGLYHYLIGESAMPKIHEREGFCEVHIGHCAQEGPELLQRPEFGKLLTELKGRFDRVILKMHESPDRTAGRLLIGYCDRIVVTLQDATYHDLDPFRSAHAGFLAT